MCDDLNARIQDSEVQARLLDWIAENIEGKAITREQVGLGGGGPGRYLRHVDFEWGILGIRDVVGEVRVIGPDVSSIEGVFFGAGARMGVIVDLDGDGEFGVDSRRIYSTTGRFAVYCVLTSDEDADKLTWGGQADADVQPDHRDDN
ncbi:hypothetical protein ASA1KI_30170 [Opitutales bacterium ASA1]|nr:hypothetical protein ASA1KI_30170 [Opitutales bacterium ASA1]